jgi:hypothetical protein
MTLNTETVADMLGAIVAQLRQAADDLDRCVVALGGTTAGHPSPVPGVAPGDRCTCGHPYRVHVRRRGELAPGIVCAGFGCACEVFALAGPAEVVEVGEAQHDPGVHPHGGRCGDCQLPAGGEA